MSTHRPADGLLEQIADHALDDDYYVVRSGESAGDRRFGTAVTGLVLLAFAALVTVAAVQARTDRPATELEQRTLVADIEQRRELQETRSGIVEALRKDVAELRNEVEASDPRQEALRVLTGDQGAVGEGVVVEASGSSEENRSGRVTATDLQILVNGLWYAGAEAVAVDGHRLSSRSSIQFVDGSITVNYRRVQSPFTVLAIGDGESLRERFESNPAGRYWANRGTSAGLRLVMTPSEDVAVPAAPSRSVTLRHAEALEEDDQ